MWTERSGTGGPRTGSASSGSTRSDPATRWHRWFGTLAYWIRRFFQQANRNVLPGGGGPMDKVLRELLRFLAAG